MKKILGVIILGLLLSGNVFAEKIPDMTNSAWAVKYGSGPGSKYKLHFKPNGDCTYGYWDVWNRTFKDCEWTQKGNKVVMLGNHKKGNTGFNFKLTVSGYSGTGAQFANSDNRLMGTFSSVKATYIESWLAGSSNTNTSSSSSRSSTNDKISQSKQICKDLGFKTNTEKFADCALKMMSIQFEATNKVASGSGGTTQEIIVKHQNDYDIFDAMIDVSNAMLSNNKKSSSSSSNRGTNCVIGRTNPTFGTTTMNCR